MAVPVSLQTYPADDDTGIPIGISLEIIFDKGIDLSTAKDHVVLYGADFDSTSGPGSAQWVDSENLTNPYYLRSPGFKGLVELTASVVYVDLSTGPTYTVVDPGAITSEADEAAYGTSGVGHKLILTPREQLAGDVSYTAHILGDPDAVGSGISSRTVFDVVPDPGNAGSTGEVINYGGYDGTMGSDTVVVEITTSGDIGTAKYRWYYASAGVGSAKSGLLTSRRFRRLEHGIQLRFGGSGFVSGDTYEFNVEAPERLAANFVIDFTTNDGTYTAAPSSPSTPATSLPPSTVLPPAPGSSSASSTDLEVLEMNPAHGSYQNDINTRTVTILFDDLIDAATVTDATVRIYKYPASGVYQNYKVVELAKKLTVSGDTLTIEF